MTLLAILFLGWPSAILGFALLVAGMHARCDQGLSAIHFMG